MKRRRIASTLLAVGIALLLGDCMLDSQGSAPAPAAAGGAANAGSSGSGAVAGSAGSSGGGSAGEDASEEPDAPLDAGADAPDGPHDAADVGADVPSDTPPCPPGAKLCPNGCVTTDTPTYGCANPTCDPCALPHAFSHLCVGGVCAATACTVQFGDCNGDPYDGCERNLRTLSDCGGCDIPCPLPFEAGSDAATDADDASSAEAGDAEGPDGDSGGDVADAPEVEAGVFSCATSSCLPASCPPGFEDCDGDPSNGCEQSLSTSDNCGACELACLPLHGSGGCSTGTCLLTSCSASWGDCDADPSNGCETSLKTTREHCGGCSEPCSTIGSSSQTCSGGLCIHGCLLGQLDCNGLLPGATDDGCETTGNTCP